MAALRRLAAAIAGTLAAVLLPLSMVSVWVAGVVTDTHRYVATVGPLADDPTVQNAAIRALDADALKLIDLGIRTPALVRYLRSHGFAHLADAGGTLTTAVRQQIGATAAELVTAAVKGPHFAAAWKAANRTAHEELIRILEHRSAIVDDSGRVSVELGAVLNAIAAALQQQGLIRPGALPQVHTSFALIRTGDLKKVRSYYRTLDALGFWLPIGWLIAFAAAVLLARRRIRAVRLVLFGSVIGLMVVIIGSVALGGRIADRSPDTDVARAVWDRLTSDLRLALLVTSLLAAAGFTWLSTLVPNRIGQPPGRNAILLARITAGILVVVAGVMAVTG